MMFKLRDDLHEQRIDQAEAEVTTSAVIRRVMVRYFQREEAGTAFAYPAVEPKDLEEAETPVVRALLERIQAFHTKRQLNRWFARATTKS